MSIVNGEYIFPTLEYCTVRGAPIRWEIRISLKLESVVIPITAEMIAAKNLPAAYIAEINVISSQIKVREHVPTFVTCGKNIGRANQTTVLTQAIKDAAGLHNKQKKKTIQKADYPLPMLVRKINSSKASTLSTADFAAGVTVQRKLNGIHAVAFLNESEIIMYTRTGIEIVGQQHLRDVLRKWLPPNIYLAGELYLHGKPLNWISGQSRNGDDMAMLEYHIFDCFDPTNLSQPSRVRQKILDDLFAHKQPGLVRVENFPVTSMVEITALAERFVDEHYEGAIARKDAAPYQLSYNNYHSNDVVKIKVREDDDFTIVGFTEGIKGKDLGAIIWTCETADGEEFSVVPCLTYKTRRNLYTRLSGDHALFTRYFRGRLLIVAYAELSETGKPLQAKGMALRTYEDDDSDEINALMIDCERAD